MAYKSDEIRGVMIPVGTERLLLPNATVAEVLARVEVEPVAGAPEWLAGRIAWHGWQVPMIVFSRCPESSRYSSRRPISWSV